METKNYINEVWKPIIGFDGLVETSNFGRVRTLDRSIHMPNGGTRIIQGRIIKQYLSNGYCIVFLGFTHETRTSYYVHRLVARAFPEICGEWFDGCEIDHINTIKNDNVATNLKVVTPSENANNPLTVKHQREVKLGKKMSEDFRKKVSEAQKGKKRSNITKLRISKALKKPIVQILQNGTEFCCYFSATDASSDLGISRKSINNCCLGKQKTAGGFGWSYT